MCIFFYDKNGKREYSFSSINDDVLTHVLLPISKNQVIIGVENGWDISLEEEEINNASASCSNEFFVSGQSNDKYRSLQSVIGKSSYFQTDDELTEMIQSEDFLREIGLIEI